MVTGGGTNPVTGVTIGGQPAIDFSGGLTSGTSSAELTSGSFASTSARTVYAVLSFVGAQAVNAQIVYTTAGGVSAADCWLGVEVQTYGMPYYTGELFIDLNQLWNGPPLVHGGVYGSPSYVMFACDGIGGGHSSNTATEYLWQNGGFQSSLGGIYAPDPSNYSWTIGQSALFHCAELIVWNRYLSGGEQAQVNAYMHARYGL